MSSALNCPLRFIKIKSVEKLKKYVKIDFEVDDPFEFNNKMVALREGGEALLSKFLTKDEHFKVYKDYGVIAINEKLASKDY
jgi:hypothetical protein